MAADDLKKIKELLEVVNNKVGKLETHVYLHSSTVRSIKEQQSVMNEKLDDLKADIKKLDQKADGILEFAQEADEEAEKTKRRLSAIEQIPVIAQALD
mgnify:CR=1 FL=1